MALSSTANLTGTVFEVVSVSLIELERLLALTSLSGTGRTARTEFVSRAQEKMRASLQSQGCQLGKVTQHSLPPSKATP